MHQSSDPLVNAIADQFEAEAAEVRRLVPAGNSVLRSDPAIRSVIHHAITTIDDHGAAGTAQVLRYSALTGQATTYTRTGSTPVVGSGVVRHCHSCNAPTGITAAFWIASGQYIVQIDLCSTCTLAALDKGAHPQFGVTED